MITENLSMEHKIVNGTAGILMDVVYKSEAEGHKAVCAYVKVKSSSISIEDLPEAVIPIFPKSVQFTHQISRSKSIQINRAQLPLVPAWAFTDYKVQGTSMNTVIVDLASAQGIQNAYVMLSHTSSLQNLAVFRWFMPHRIFSCLQEDLRNKLIRVAQLNYQTQEWFTRRDQQLPCESS